METEATVRYRPLTDHFFIFMLVTACRVWPWYLPRATVMDPG